MRKINKKWFLQKFKEQDESMRSMRSIAPRLGMDHTTLSRKLSGQKGVTLEDVEALADMLDVKTVDVLKAFGMKIRE